MIASTRNILDTLEILESRELDSHCYEVCASGVGTFDEAGQRLEVKLEAYVRRFEIRGKDLLFRPPWLPKPDAVHFHLSGEEAYDAAKDVFGAWVKKVRKAIPSSDEWKKEENWTPL